MNINDFRINSIDDRGFYVAYTGDGTYMNHYLQRNLTLFFGVRGPSGGFWGAKSEAEKALKKFLDKKKRLRYSWPFALGVS